MQRMQGTICQVSKWLKVFILMNTWIAGKDLMKFHYQIKKVFYSKLNLEDLTDKDYSHAQKVFIRMLKNLSSKHIGMLKQIVNI